LSNCRLTANSAQLGGGAHDSTLNNCLLSGNSASGQGGGACGGILDNCTVSDNSCTRTGGGVSWSTANNSVLYYNTANGAPNHESSTLNYCCTVPFASDGFGNIVAEPLFVDRLNGNLHLQSTSPCINKGNNGYVSGATDLDGHPRIDGRAVDMGAYEFQTPISVLFTVWLHQYGLPTDGSANFTDNDADTLNNWEEWVCGTNPTNALSALRLLTPVSDGTSSTVTWESVAGRTYLLERAYGLGAGSAFIPVASGIPGRADTTSYTDTNEFIFGSSLYRVGIQP